MSDLVATQPLEQSELSPFDALPNGMMRAFVREYCTGELTGKRFNATRAAEAAGYADITATGHRLKRRPDVKAAIQWFLNEIAITNEEIIGRLQAMAEADIGSIVDTSMGSPRLDIEKLDKVKHLIKGFSLDSNGNPKIEFHDPHAALKDLMRVRGLGKDGIELSGPGGGAIPVQLQVNFVVPRAMEDRNRLPGG